MLGNSSKWTPMNLSVCDWLVALRVIFSRFFLFCVIYSVLQSFPWLNNPPLWAVCGFPALWRLRREGIPSLKLAWSVELECYYRYLEIYFIYYVYNSVCLDSRVFPHMGSS